MIPSELERAHSEEAAFICFSELMLHSWSFCSNNLWGWSCFFLKQSWFSYIEKKKRLINGLWATLLEWVNNSLLWRLNARKYDWNVPQGHLSSWNHTSKRQNRIWLSSCWFFRSLKLNTSEMFPEKVVVFLLFQINIPLGAPRTQLVLWWYLDPDISWKDAFRADRTLQSCHQGPRPQTDSSPSSVQRTGLVPGDSALISRGKCQRMDVTDQRGAHDDQSNDQTAEVIQNGSVEQKCGPRTQLCSKSVLIRGVY